MSNSELTTSSYDHQYTQYEVEVKGFKALHGDAVSEKDVGLSWAPRLKNRHVYDLTPVRVAIFGLGRIGTIHLEKILSLPSLQLLYCVEDSLERANYVSMLWRLEDRGVKVVATNEVEQIYSDPNVDAIFVCTPTESHEEIVLKGLAAGKAIFCEKPFAKKAPAIEKCYKLAEEKSLPIFCAFNRRFDPGFAQLRQRVLSGAVGRVHVIKTTSRDCPLPSIEYLSTSGGIYQDCIVHDIDLICWILGEFPISVTSQAHCFRPEIAAIDDFDTVAVTMKFPSGALGIIDVSRFAVYGYDIRLEVFGDKGMIECNEKRPTQVKISADQGSTVAPICFSFASRFYEAYKAEALHFVELFKGVVEPSVTAESTLAVNKIASACETAARTGTTVGVHWP
jgi:myo-inositol 2-dehydrogenase/D-chiro-inositol 1-dehydrogenase